MATAPQPKRSRRRLPRWAWALIMLAVLAGGSALAFRLYYGPRVPIIAARRLPADTSRIIFSANGVGYPAAIVRQIQSPLGIWLTNGYLLNDDGTLSEERFHCNGTTIISPNRQVAVDRNLKLNPREANLVWRSGGRGQITVPPPSDQHWLFPTDAGGVHDGNRCYYENGRRMVTLPPGYRFLQNFQCQDPDYLPLAGPHRRHPDRPGVLGVYDLRKHTIISLGQTSPGGNNGIIFHRNGRFLLNYGTPIIIDPGPRIVPYQPPKAFTAGRQLWDADWCWGEDSTIWMVDGATAFVLDWRHGSPVFRALPCQASPDPRIKASAFQWVNPGTATTHDRQASGVAVWGDGRLVACVRTQPALPQPIARLCDKTTWAKGIPREVRELVLYRDGRRAGWYRLPLDLTVKSLPDPMQYFSIPSIRGFKPKPPPLILAREHLAFTKDGTRLAWVVETAKGKRIYVFKVPQ